MAFIEQPDHGPRERDFYAPDTSLIRETPALPNSAQDIIVFPAGEQVSPGMQRLAEIVGPERWNRLSRLAKSDMTPEEAVAFRTTLLKNPLSNGAQATEWNKHDWRVSRHYADDAFTMVEIHNSSGMREAQAGFAQGLNNFILGIPEGDEDTRELLRAFLKIGTSDDWEKNPDLAREVDNAYWDVGDKVLESWTSQPHIQH